MSLSLHFLSISWF